MLSPVALATWPIFAARLTASLNPIITLQSGVDSRVKHFLRRATARGPRRVLHNRPAALRLAYERGWTGSKILWCDESKEEFAGSDGLVLRPYRAPPGQFGHAEPFAQGVSRTNRGAR